MTGLTWEVILTNKKKIFSLWFALTLLISMSSCSPESMIILDKGSCFAGCEGLGKSCKHATQNKEEICLEYRQCKAKCTQ